MVSNRSPVTTVAGLEINTLGDGFFHAGTYLFTVTALFLLWGATRRHHEPWPMGVLVGMLLIGWGLFNLVEDVVDHHQECHLIPQACQGRISR